MSLRIAVVAAQALLPWLCLLYLPRLTVNASLEDAVDRALPVAVATTTAAHLLCSPALFVASCSSKRSLGVRFVHGLIGLVVGAVVFHVVIVLFGAPLYQLVLRTAQLALLLSAGSFLPLAAHLGLSPSDWIDAVLNVRARDERDVLVASASIATTLGAYVGALPIPLDWDRPWQQWPLTCVYGAVAGHSIGLVVACVLLAMGWTSLDRKKE